MADINKITSLIDSYLENNGLDHVEANEISLYLGKNNVLSHSTKGQPLRKLLREGKIPNAEQPGGKGTAWYIRHSIDKTLQATSMNARNHQTVAPLMRSCNTLTKGLAPISDAKSEILILGTLPGKASLRVQQYYANRGNQFWAIISNIFNDSLPVTYEEKIKLLKKHHIALWDILKSAQRNCSLDSDIKNPETNDILGFITEHPNLHIIGLNGKDALKYLKKCVHLNRISRDIQVVPLTSTSPTNTHFSLDEKIANWKTILKR